MSRNQYRYIYDGMLLQLSYTYRKGLSLGHGFSTLTIKIIFLNHIITTFAHH